MVAETREPYDTAAPGVSSSTTATPAPASLHERRARRSAKATDEPAANAWYKGTVPIPGWAFEAGWLAHFGRALPLLGYLCQRVSWDTGHVLGYRHEDAATALGCVRTTIAQQFRLLRESGKVVVLAKHRYDLDLRVLAHDPSSAPSEYQNIATLGPSDYQEIDTLAPSEYQNIDRLAGPEYQNIAARVSKNGYSETGDTYYMDITSSSLTDTNVSDAAAVGLRVVTHDDPPPSDARESGAYPSLVGDDGGAEREHTTSEPAISTTQSPDVVASQQAPSPDSAPPSSPRASGRVNSAEAERHDGETDRQYWLRVVRETAENKRLAVLMHLAHEKLGVSLARGRSDAWSWMGKLAREHGAALMVKWILAASAEDILGDPMKYLTTVANRSQQRAEAAANRARAAPVGRAGADPGPQLSAIPRLT